MATKREDGEDFPAEAFAYVPDPDLPSSWKLRLWDTVADKETAAQVGRAVAALGPGGFRGNRVVIPAGDLPRVKAKVLAAWRKVNPDASADDEPTILKGWGMEYKDDDMETADPLDEILDAYASAARMGDPGKDLADAILALVPDIAAMFGMLYQESMGMGRRVLRNGYEASNPMKCLLGTYEALLMFPDGADLRNKVMELIHMAEGIVMPQAEVPETPETETEDAMGMGQREPIMRMVREQDGQYCVYSEQSGRSFGCYLSRQAAEERLAQIETFANAQLASASTKQLVEWHNRLHDMNATPAVKEIHDLLEDELEARGLARPYSFNEDDKLSLVERGPQDILAKAAEYRYTLGPVYVPGIEDAHGEFTDADTLQKALWDWVRKGDRRIFLQHGDKVAGEAVEVLTWPFAVEAQLGVPGQGITKYTFPANTPFMGVIWEGWAWDLVKSGKLRGYSIGGHARRMEADLPVESKL